MLFDSMLNLIYQTALFPLPSSLLFSDDSFLHSVTLQSTHFHCQCLRVQLQHLLRRTEKGEYSSKSLQKLLQYADIGSPQT